MAIAHKGHIFRFYSQYPFYTVLAALCRWFSPGTPVSSTNKTDLHDITEILLKVALNTIIQPTVKYCYPVPASLTLIITVQYHLLISSFSILK